MWNWSAVRTGSGAKAQGLVQRALLLVNSRKVWVIHPSFQLRVVLYGVSIAAFSLLLTFASIQFFFWRCQGVLLQQGVPLNHPIYVFLTEQERFMGVIYLGVAVLSLVVGVFAGLVLSHRVAGPIHRMRTHLLEAAAGRAARPLKFRDADYFKELADAYNAELQTRGRIRRPGSELNREERNAEVPTQQETPRAA